MRVVFDHDPRVGAFTTNLSLGGICVASDYVAPTGTEVSAAIQLADGQLANFEAVVIWVKKVRGSLDEKSSMGLEFVIPPGEEYNTYVSETLALGRESTTGGGHVSVATGPALAALTPNEPRTVSRPSPSVGDRSPQPERGDPLRPTASGFPAAVLAFPAAPLGLSGRIDTIVGDRELAASAPFTCGVSPAAAATWCEQAAERCLRDLLPLGATTVGLSTHVRVRHDRAVQPGDKVKVTATVTEALDERTVTLAVRAEKDGVLIATGNHICALIGRS